MTDQEGILSVIFPDPLNPESQIVSRGISHYLFYYNSKMVKLS